MKTGNTWLTATVDLGEYAPQWSPVMKTGNTSDASDAVRARSGPQWSPVMKTGNTRCVELPEGQRVRASMEPGHEDREYLGGSPGLR